MFEQQTLLINKVLNKIDRCLQKKKKSRRFEVSFQFIQS